MDNTKASESEAQQLLGLHIHCFNCGLPFVLGGRQCPHCAAITSGSAASRVAEIARRKKGADRLPDA